MDSPSPHSVAFMVVGVPAPQGSMKSFGSGYMTHSNKKTMPWRATVQSVAARVQQQTGFYVSDEEDVAYAVELEFVFPRTKTMRKKDHLHTTTPDIDKLERAILDSLTGYLFDDDKLVYTSRKERRYTLYGQSWDVPGVYIRLTKVPKAQVSPCRLSSELRASGELL